MIKRFVVDRVVAGSDYTPYVRDVLVSLGTLADGCPEHPEYRAAAFPRADCVHCKHVWRTKEKLFFPEPDEG